MLNCDFLCFCVCVLLFNLTRMCVLLFVSPGSWSDNGFLMLHGETIELTFTPQADLVLTVEELQASLRVTSLTDTFPASHWEKETAEAAPLMTDSDTNSEENITADRS